MDGQVISIVQCNDLNVMSFRPQRPASLKSALEKKWKGLKLRNAKKFIPTAYILGNSIVFMNSLFKV
jgi:hypothetical protein